MDPLNIITGIVLLYSITANISGAKKAMKKKLTGVLERPKSYLQKTPPNISALILIFTILGVFKIGTFQTEIENQYLVVRLIGLAMFGFFSWVQVTSYKSLGENYSQDIVLLKGQSIVKTGVYKMIRHPQYVSQILSDLGAGLALLSYLVVPTVLLIELPLFILRAKLEEEMLNKHLNNEYASYKKQSGFFVPFIG